MSFCLLDKFTRRGFIFSKIKIFKTKPKNWRDMKTNYPRNPTVSHLRYVLIPFIQFPNDLQFVFILPFCPSGSAYVKSQQTTPICPFWHSPSDHDPLVSLLHSDTRDSHDGLRSSPCSSVPEDEDSSQMWPQHTTSVATTVSTTSSVFCGATYQCISNMPSWAFTSPSSRKLTQVCGIHFVVTFHLLIDWKQATLKKGGWEEEERY